MTLTSEAGKDGGVLTRRSCFSCTGAATDLGMSTLGKGGALSRTGKTDVKAPGVQDFPGLPTIWIRKWT